MPYKDPAKKAENRRLNYLKNRDREIARMREWQAENPDRHRDARRRSALKVRYGIDEAAYEAMLSKQSGRCAICAAEPKSGTRLHIDHRHSDGVVRGLLCGLCNRALGLLADDPVRADRLISYLGG